MIHFGGLTDEQTISVPLGCVGAKEEEAAENRQLAQLQQIGYCVRCGA